MVAESTQHVIADLEGRHALVTGGARGLGHAMAASLVAAGASVSVLDTVVPESVQRGVVAYSTDIRDFDAVVKTVADLPSPPQLLVNNAGITRDRTIAKMSMEEWHSVLNVNLTGAFNLIRACAPGMADSGFGRIVNISSINGLRGKFGQANYSASKAGLIGLTKTAAREFGRKGVTVNAVAPGMVLTDMVLSVPADIRNQALDESALGHLAEPEDIANAVLFLLSDAARMITGQVLQVDAGQNT
jgi:acetoacetyl-CoA reductase/3-oxoacyl-[acyl-carrier protein] reductase